MNSQQPLTPMGILFVAVIFWGVFMWATEKTIAVYRLIRRLIREE